MNEFKFTRGSHHTRQENLRTLALLTFAYTMVFTAYYCLEIFQSSINFQDGIGLASMAVLYAAYAVASIGTAPVLVAKLTAKWALRMAWFSHTLFICANIYPVWATMVPASALLGLMSPVTWIVQGVYFTALSRRYSVLTFQSLQKVMGRFGAVLDQIESISQLIGSAIAVGVLHSVGSTNENYGEEVSGNNTSALDNNRSSTFHYYHTNCSGVCMENSSCVGCSNRTRDTGMCGPNHCPYLHGHTDVLVKPPPVLLYILLGLLLGCNLSGILSTFFLTNIRTNREQTSCQKYTRPVQLFLNPRLYLIMWPFVHANFLFSVYCGAFHQSFVSCTLGVAMVGYTFMVASVSRSLTAVISGNLIKYIPRVYHYTAGCVLSVVLGVTWTFWEPEPDQLGIFFLVAITFGASVSLVRIHIRGLVVDVFHGHPEAGFAQRCLWYAVGSALAYGLNRSLCLLAKALILIGLSIAAGGAFVSLEILLHFAKKSAAKQVEKQFEEEQRRQSLLHSKTARQNVLQADTTESEKL